MAKFSVRFDIASAYVVEVEAESAEAAVALVEADPHGFAEANDGNNYAGWDLIYPSVAQEVK